MNQSEQINELATALAKAQGQIEGAKKDAKNPFFKSSYADLQSIWEAIRDPLSKNGLSVAQLTGYNENHLGVITKIMHSSGQWIEGFFPILASKPNDAQALGSATSYARRYALAAAVGVYQVDDDGQAAMVKPTPKQDRVLKEIDAIEMSITSDRGLGAMLAETKAILDQGRPDNDYVIKWGLFSGRKLVEVSAKYLEQMIDKVRTDTKGNLAKANPDEQEFVKAAKAYLEKTTKKDSNEHSLQQNS